MNLEQIFLCGFFLPHVVSFFRSDSFSAALGAICVTTELVVEELEPHIETLLTAAVKRSE